MFAVKAKLQNFNWKLLKSHESQYSNQILENTFFENGFTKLYTE